MPFCKPLCISECEVCKVQPRDTVVTLLDVNVSFVRLGCFRGVRAVIGSLTAASNTKLLRGGPAPVAVLAEHEWRRAPSKTQKTKFFAMSLMMASAEDARLEGSEQYHVISWKPLYWYEARSITSCPDSLSFGLCSNRVGWCGPFSKVSELLQALSPFAKVSSQPPTDHSWLCCASPQSPQLMKGGSTGKWLWRV